MAARSRCRRALQVLAALSAALAGAGCFTDPVNQPPQITALAARMPVVRGEPAWFTATVSDPDTDQPPITPRWISVAGDCPVDTTPSHRPTGAQPVPSDMQDFMVGGDATGGSFCVWVFATDRYGATAVKMLQVRPDDRPPQARIDVVNPDCTDTDPAVPTGCRYPLYSDFSLSGASSSDPDGDPLADYTWTFESTPAGSTATLAPCPLGGPETSCFSADLPGQYKVALSVRALQEQGSSTITLSVADDQPPCIAISRPDYLSTLLVHDPTVMESFIVDRVSDDGDPYPRSAHGETHFTWYVGRPGEPLAFKDNDFHSLDLALGTFSLGDTGIVRVEIHDRNTRAIDNVLLGCGDSDVCAARSGCFQRVSWKIEYLR